MANDSQSENNMVGFSGLDIDPEASLIEDESQADGISILDDVKVEEISESKVQVEVPSASHYEE